MSDDYKVSVCMATYNGEKYLTQQLDSILSQLSSKDELIISDDGSTDATVSIIKSYNDNRIVLLNNNRHNYTQNFENALKHASGDYIFLCDQDDIWSKDKIKISINYLQVYDFLYSDARVINSSGEVVLDSRNNYFNIHNGFYRNLIKTHYIGCCMAFTKKVLEAVIPFPKNRELCFHDGWISFLSEKCFKTYVCPEKLIDYRRHGNNVSSGSVGITNSIGKILKIRIYMMSEVLKRQKELKRNGYI